MGNTQTNENNSEIEKELLDKTAEKNLKYILKKKKEKDKEEELKQAQKRGREVYNDLDKALIEKKNAENFVKNEIEGEALWNKEIEIKKRSEGVKDLKNNYKNVSDEIENAAESDQKYVGTGNNKRQRTADGKKRKSKTKKTKSTRKNKKKN